MLQDASPDSAVPQSMLDTDLYKLTMQQAVFYHFPDVQSTYRFTLRDKDVYFTRRCIDQFRAAIIQFGELVITSPELEWLKTTCPFFKPSYLDYLSSFRLNPSQIHVKFTPVSADGEYGNLNIEASGLWVETIFWEVPLMACLSEIYFRVVKTDWSNVGQSEGAYDKARALLEAGCLFSEFGTRRRRSFHIQDLVLQSLIRASHDAPGKGTLSGTSNVHLAHKHGIRPIGTMAHEWFMGVAALKGYEHANEIALDLWEEIYPDRLLYTLTDTFSTGIFFKAFIADPERARRWKGLRQDSGDPFAFVALAKKVYETLGIDHREKAIMFSDSLNLDKALQLKKQCDNVGFQASFGIGTFLTNDFYTMSSGGTEKSKPLNMVIKLASVDEEPCLKISDDLGKSNGDPATVQMVKAILGLDSSTSP